MSSCVYFVLTAQFLIGLGVVTRLRAVTNGFSLLGLAMLTGLGISSGLPIMLELVHLPIAPGPTFVGLSLLAVVSLGLLRGQLAYWRAFFTWRRLAVRWCELPFVAFWIYLLLISAWKCAWFPNIPFDTLVGPDLVARYAVREHTLVSSVFTEHLPSVSVFSNQPFYAPFTAMQQIMYVLAAQETGPFAFGKVWLTVLVVAFGLFFYAELRERLHPLLAGTLVTVLACTPELFVYTFLVQTDWANAAFLATGVILLQRHLESGQRGTLTGSALLLAIACWTRTETVFFVPIGSLLVFINLVPVSPKKAIAQSFGLFFACLLPVLFWNYGFLRGYVSLPATAHLGTFHAVSGDYFGKLLGVYARMNTQVILNLAYWNYAVPVFFSLLGLNFLIFRDRRGWPMLVWLAGIYLLFGLLILHVDGANVPYTFRRGFFKLLFLMYGYLSTTRIVGWVSDWLYRWEGHNNHLPVIENRMK